MKKLSAIPALLLTMWAIITSLAPIDDTTALQTILNGGDVTLSASHTYNISSHVDVKGVVNMNHAVIHYTGTAGDAVRLTTVGASLSNGTVQGDWVYTTAGSSSGAVGIHIMANNATISNVIAKQFSGYGILSDNYTNLNVTGNTIEKTGYVGFWYSSNATTTIGSTFSNNIIDRSMLPSSTVQQPAVVVRSGTSNPAFTISNWTISGNTFKMPLNPTSIAAEGIEVRYLVNSTISYNTATQGSIGISIVRSSGLTTHHNKTTNSGHEGIEYADSHACVDSCNKVTGSSDIGYRFDGAIDYAHHITLNKDTASGTAHAAIGFDNFTHHITITNCNFTHTSIGIDMNQSNYLTIGGTTINGSGASNSIGIKVSNSPGNITWNSGNNINAKYQVFVSNTQTNALIDSIFIHNVLHSGTTNQIGSYLQNGAHLGSNISFTTSTLVFNTLPTKTYGDSNFAPGAVSTNAITYSSANTSVATIVSGNIHIVGAGTANITANDGDTSIVRSFTVNKAGLIIAADTKFKTQGAPNPSLTASYIGFVNGETNSVLTAQPTASTTAVTGSPIGIYPITASGATAANYSISYLPGSLIVTGYRVIHRIFKAAH